MTPVLSLPLIKRKSTETYSTKSFTCKISSHNPTIPFYLTTLLKAFKKNTIQEEDTQISSKSYKWSAKEVLEKSTKQRTV